MERLIGRSQADAVISEHLFNGRIPQQNFPQKKKQKADQSGRHVLAGRTAGAAALSAFGGVRGDVYKKEADSRG